MPTVKLEHLQNIFNLNLLFINIARASRFLKQLVVARQSIVVFTLQILCFFFQISVYTRSVSISIGTVHDRNYDTAMINKWINSSSSNLLSSMQNLGHHTFNRVYHMSLSYRDLEILLVKIYFIVTLPHIVIMFIRFIVSAVGFALIKNEVRSGTGVIIRITTV